MKPCFLFLMIACAFSAALVSFAGCENTSSNTMPQRPEQFAHPSSTASTYYAVPAPSPAPMR